MAALEFLPASTGTGIIPAGAGKIDPPLPLQNFGDGLQHHGSPDRAGVRLRLPTRAGGDERLKQLPPVFVAEDPLGAPVWMGHEAEDVPLLVQNPGDGLDRAGGIGLRGQAPLLVAIAEGDAPLRLQPLQSFRIGEVAPFPVPHRHPQDLARPQLPGEGRVLALGPKPQISADVLEVAIADEGPGQQPRFNQDLKTVANSEDPASLPGEPDDTLHNRGKFGHRPAAEVIAVGEAPGKDDAVATGKRPVLVPEKTGLLTQDVLHHMVAIVLAVRAGENHDAELQPAFSLVHDFVAEVLNDPVDQELLAQLLHLPLQLLLGHLRDGQLHDLPRAHVGYVLVPELVQGGQDGPPLRVQNPALVHHYYSNFHPAPLRAASSRVPSRLSEDPPKDHRYVAQLPLQVETTI